MFAMWMTRPTAAAAPDFRAARDEGLLRIEEIVTAYANNTPLKPDDIRNYLTRNIVFHLDDGLTGGMETYFNLAEKHGLIPEQKPLKFVER